MKHAQPIEARTPLPQVVLSRSTLDRLENMAEAAVKRTPETAERLLEELSRAVVVDDAELPEDVVAIGSRVTYRDEASGKERTVQLVFPEDADIAAGRISVMTPIGVALLGLPKGAAFHWDTLNHERRTLTVIEVTQTAD